MTLIDRSRWIGAAAGLGPTAAIGAWWAWVGIRVSFGDWLVSMGLLAAIAMSAGWIAGPLAAAARRGLAKATIGYAIAVIGATATLSIIQGGADSILTGDASIGGLAEAIVGQVLVAVAGIAYLILPALGLGVIWTMLARVILWATRRTAAAG